MCLELFFRRLCVYMPRAKRTLMTTRDVICIGDWIDIHSANMGLVNVNFTWTLRDRSLLYEGLVCYI